jgi:hypothetical protein
LIRTYLSRKRVTAAPRAKIPINQPGAAKTANAASPAKRKYKIRNQVERAEGIFISISFESVLTTLSTIPINKWKGKKFL